MRDANENGGGRDDERGAPLHHEDPTARDARHQQGARADAGGESGAAHRRNPPPMENVDGSEGGIAMSGGVSGGTRGNAGSSDRIMPSEEGRSGPAQYKGTSRTDLDHPSSDVADPHDRGRDQRAAEQARGDGEDRGGR